MRARWDQVPAFRLLCGKFKNGLSLILRPAWSTNLVPINEALAVDANTLNHDEFMSEMAAMRLLHECIVVPIAKIESARPCLCVVVTPAAKSTYGSRFLALHDHLPPLVNPPPHFLS